MAEEDDMAAAIAASEAAELEDALRLIADAEAKNVVLDSTSTTGTTSGAGGGISAADAFRASISDSDILNQESLIRTQIQETQPLIAEREPSAILISKYQDNPGSWIPKIQDFAQSYTHIRCMRGDGSCFYRSLLVSMAEQFVMAGVRYPSPLPASGRSSSGSGGAVGGGGSGIATTSTISPLQQAYDNLLAHVEASTDSLIALGYPDSTTPDFTTMLRDYIRNLGKLDATVAESALAPLRVEGGEFTLYGLYAMRLLTSLELRTNEEMYLPFVLGCSEAPTVEIFCSTEVETPQHDADQPQIMALTSALGKAGVLAATHIAYLDASPGNKMQHVVIPGTSGGSDSSTAAAAAAAPGPVTVHLLYRPGHYDIAYPKQ